MTLSHTPAYTTIHPDTYTDETTGRTFEVFHDLSAEDPREWIENEHAAIWAYRQPSLGSSSIADYPEGNHVLDAFKHFYEAFDDDRKALDATVRWMLLFHPENDSSIIISTIRGYSQSDWLDVVAVVEHGYGTPEGHINTLRQWAFGDVWVVSEDDGDSLAGIYADDAEDAVQQYLTNYDQKVTAQRTLSLTVTADSESEIDAKVAQVIDAIADSDALPTGIVASAAPKDIDPDWLDDIADVLQTDHVDVSWRARNERGRVIFDSDMTLTPTQAAGMFRAIGENS